MSEWPRLAQMYRAGDVDGLIRELDDPRSEDAGRGNHFTVRQKAALLLGRMREPRAAEPIARLLQDPLPTVRSLAARALGMIGDGSATEPLIKALKDTHPDVCRNAAYSLGDIGSEDAVPALIERLADEDPWTRMAAAKAVVRIGDPRALVPLKEAVRREGFRHPTIRLRMSKAYFLLRARVATSGG